ncbi:winged helix DNA-binding protein [Natronococcus sp. JC468]|uniref:MarR family winged helix-turn-helix transcriptional regulator n=1 Tax=Natronococcus sp. JC468 TaxID=1961921 RepID=UPI00143AD71A|nr:MarR family transcriptional regulator [Natronococcus sp. JC468]NKE37537.1 winged helix DNA-binding protein [Natronococcus sp. JC468]
MVRSSPDLLADLPPSAKLVFLVLAQEGPLTQQELVEESRLVSRTTRYALSELEESGLIEKNISFKDARQRIYSLSEEGEAIEQTIDN